ncbi:MAG TPA: hypothetical protein VK324_04685, partial [Tepidisphaeraceae bacterium]|nr:hypothetical protein [Tepidisphaeraceae bacterium]
MFYLLVQLLRDRLEDAGLGFLRVFTFTTFQASIAVIVSFVGVIAAGPRFIDWLRRKKIGDRPDFDQKQLNEIMSGKSGTPTMGGVLILTAIFTASVLLAN